MRPKLLQLAQEPGGRYLVIGGSVYLFELLVIIVVQALGSGPVTAVAWSFVLGTVLSFGLQKFVTFRDRRMQHKIVLTQALAVGLLVLFNFGFTLFVAKILTNVVPAVVSRTLALAVTTIWNFYLYKTRVFKSDSNPLY